MGLVAFAQRYSYMEWGECSKKNMKWVSSKCNLVDFWGWKISMVVFRVCCYVSVLEFWVCECCEIWLIVVEIHVIDGGLWLWDFDIDMKLAKSSYKYCYFV